MVREPDIRSAIDRQSEDNDSDKHHDIFQKQAAVRRWWPDTRFPLRRNTAVLTVVQYGPDPGVVRAGAAPIWRKISHFSRSLPRHPHLATIISARGHGGSSTKRGEMRQNLLCRPRT